jgi:hypothetical protein
MCDSDRFIEISETYTDRWSLKGSVAEEDLLFGDPFAPQGDGPGGVIAGMEGVGIALLERGISNAV